ncbi:MAG TPA: TonB-dependent receptor, partial [Vicinamibacterales bacterium]|nr:TonB-dependent receptor [Vicinamibacterales bacterium]
DSSNAVLPGVTISLSGEKLIGGVQTQSTDTTGSYRFDRLPPGTYRVKFELQGFRSFERDDIVVNAAFVANVNAKLEVGNVSETVTVSGASPTIDTKSNLQQTVMNQDILEGVPSGRDPWSVAKIIPGVQVSTYDVGGTQSYQQSSFSSHGSSTNDVSFNIDGANVNWPGQGGGATMLYYDQGMFEEMNYMTSAIPAEVMAGGVSINMVTKDAGNKWRGDTRYNYSSGCLNPGDNNGKPTPGCLESDNYSSSIANGTLPSSFLGNPTKRAYDFNVAGGGALVQDRLWVNGSIRRWVVDKLVSAKQIDPVTGQVTQAIDDNTLKNYSGKAVFSVDQRQKLSFSYNWNNKIRGHRRDTPPDTVPDIASLVQLNPASSTQARYTGIRNKLVYESSFSLMSGQTSYLYQPNTPATAVRAQDSTLNTAANAAQRHEENPNSRTQFDNTVSYTTTGLGGDHLIKGGVQFARLYYDDQYDVLNNMYLLYTGGKATQVREYNTPTDAINIDKVLGLFVQDAWSLASRLTLNLGFRYDHNVGTLPAQSVAARQFAPAQSLPETSPIRQNLAVWRTGVVFDPLADGKTALKASYSRYGLQVGIDRTLNVNPLQSDFQLCTWTDPNNDGIAQPNEVTGCQGYPGLTSHYANATSGPRWPHSDEVTAGVERQIAPDTRVAVMYYHRTNRDQIGVRNIAAPPSAYTAVTINVPNAPGGTAANPAPTTATLYNLNPAFLGLQNNIVDNQPYLDTTYNGVDFSASKRLSHRWQMVAGVSLGRNEGGLNNVTTANGQSPTSDLNDPNNTLYSKGVVGLDTKVGFRLSGSYQAPGDVLIAGSLISNSGGAYVSTYSASRAAVASVVALTRGSQTVFLSARGDERLPTVTMADIRVSRAFRFGGNRKIVPELDLFNIGNAAAPVTITSAVGSSYLYPTQILAPRIIKIGFAINF